MSRKVAPYQDLVRIAREAATRGAERIRQMTRPRDPRSWGQKEAFSDFVTEVDRAAEECIAESLLAHTPEAAVLGEELSPDGPDAPLLWIVDPLDGTANYLHGYPAYAVSVAASHHGALAAGVVIDVPRDLCYHASTGGGAWCGDRRLHVSQVADAAHALIGTGFPFKVPALLPRYLRQFTAILTASGGVRRTGAASLDFADVAQGRFDGFWELYLAPWDVAAGTLLVREAGGIVTDLEGGGADVRHGAFVAGNPAIHAWLRRALDG